MSKKKDLLDFFGNKKENEIKEEIKPLEENEIKEEIKPLEENGIKEEIITLEEIDLQDACENEVKIVKIDEKKIKHEEMLQAIEEDKLAEDLYKMDVREKKKIRQDELLIRMFNIMGYNIDAMEELANIVIPREKLLDKGLTKKLMNLIPELKEVYNSSYLNCLHDNSIYKQKFPAINLVRQVLKCNFYLMTPKKISNGYEKLTGKKIVTRVFSVDKQLF